MRLFIGVFPPAAIAAQIGARLDALQLPDARWVRDENLHLTLTFLGECAASELPPLRAALERTAATQAALRLELGQLDAFPSLQRPRVLVLRTLRGEAELRAVAACLERELGPQRSSDRRSFQPHLTLARLDGSVAAAELGALAAELADARFAFDIDAIDLMQSELGGGPARYTCLHRAALRRAKDFT